MAIDQALHNTPPAWAEQQLLLQKIAQAAARGVAYSDGKTDTVVEPSKPVSIPTEYKTEAIYTASALMHIPKDYKKVKLTTKDMSCVLWALDLCITPEYVALVLPKTMEVQDMRMKAKFAITLDNEEYAVMFIGGNFEFNLATTPLRVLSFARLTSNISK